MTKVNVHAPKTNLRKKRSLGLAKGKVQIPKSFFESLPDGILDAFYGEHRGCWPPKLMR
jgi:hypothetical protein